MRIVTLNTWKGDGDYRRRIALMGRGLAALDADVVCLQECFRSVAAGADTAAALGAATGLSVVAQEARRKVRTFEGGQVGSTSGLAVLLREQPVASGIWPLPSDERDGDRLTLSVDLSAAGRRVRILCTHLTHLHESALRERQVRALLALDDGVADAVIVAGDLNAPLRAPELQALQERCFRGIYAAVDGPTLIGARAAQGLAPPPPGGPAIDHLLLLRGPEAGTLTHPVTVLDEADADGVFPSDHRGVLAQWRPGGADGPA